MHVMYILRHYSCNKIYTNIEGIYMLCIYTVTHKTESMLVHQRKNMIRAMQPSENYVILIRGDEDMGNSNQGPIDSVL